MIGTLEVKLVIMGVRSLKEKRRVLKSLKDRLSRMNVSVAEVADQDVWQSAAIGFALVSNEAAYINSVLDRILLAITENPEVELIDHHAEIMHV